MTRASASGTRPLALGTRLEFSALAIAALLVVVPGGARADEAQACAAAAGTLLVGTVVAAPSFRHGMFKKGIELSHTHLTLRSDADQSNYDVAIDNVFADGYQKNSATIPAPLNAIAVGDRIEACGQPFPGGIHFVHTNCGDPPLTNEPNGWLKKIEANGAVDPSMESGQQYCYLWPKR